jgi:hypothetical protein
MHFSASAFGWQEVRVGIINFYHGLIAYPKHKRNGNGDGLCKYNECEFSHTFLDSLDMLTLQRGVRICDSKTRVISTIYKDL